MVTDVFGNALWDYFRGKHKETLWLNNSYGDPEEMPVEAFFREEADLSELEHFAMTLASGCILDIGAGAGVHSRLFQENGFQVTALEKSTIACKVMQASGIDDVVNTDISSYEGKIYDTLWLMMNGIGLTGRIENLPGLLRHMSALLHSRGKIILDSSDIRYLYSNEIPLDRYFGEIDYQYVYNGEAGEWFTWLYLDQRMLYHYATMAGLTCQIVFENNEDQYLAVLTK